MSTIEGARTGQVASKEEQLQVRQAGFLLSKRGSDNLAVAAAAELKIKELKLPEATLALASAQVATKAAPPPVPPRQKPAAPKPDAATATAAKATPPPVPPRKNRPAPKAVADSPATKPAAPPRPKRTPTKVPAAPAAATPTPATGTAQPEIGQWAPTSTHGDLKKHQAPAEYVSKNKKTRAKAVADAGAEAYTINRKEDGRVEYGAGAAAQSRAKAKFQTAVGSEDGLHAKMATSAEVAAAAAAKARGGAGALKNTKGNVRGGYVEGETEARAEFATKVQGQGEVALGDRAKAGIKGKGQAKVAANARTAGAASLSTDGAVLKGEAAAGISAQGETEVIVEFELADLGLDAQAVLAAEAAVKTQAKGDIAVSRSGVSMDGELLAMAGATAQASGETSAKLYGRKVLSAKGSAGVHAGYIYGAKGGFEIRGGRIRINLGLAASHALPAGVNAELEPSADLKPIATFIARQYAGMTWRLNEEHAKTVIKDCAKSKEALMKDLKAYSSTKTRKLAARSASNYVKLENVQKYISKRFPVYLLQDEKFDTTSIDEAIKSAIEQSLIPKKGKAVEATVVRGYVKSINNLAFDNGPELELPGAAMDVDVTTGEVHSTSSLSG
jgi:hypothetical protein